MQVAWSREGAWREAVSVMTEIIGCKKEAILLDSCERGRYTLLAWDPVEKVEFDHEQEWDPFSLLNQFTGRAPVVSPLPDDAPPFMTGVIGYYGYEAGWGQASLGVPKPPSSVVKDMVLWLPGKTLIFDHVQTAIWVVVTTLDEDPRPILTTLLQEISATPVTKPAIQGGKEKGSFVPEIDFSTYVEGFHQIQEYIRRGDIYQANYAYRVEGELEGCSWDLYQVLRQRNPGAYGAYLRFRDYAFLSSSPEQFLRLRHKQLETKPIKGTRPRGRSEQEDQQFRHELAVSEKDQAELVMIVDLERNDFGKVCEIGSVQVSELFRIEPYPTVWHQLARVTGKIKPGVTMGDVLRATFPGGSITGAPKRRAMQVIHEVEQGRRGIYTGSIGYVDPRGFSEWNIAIRTMTWLGQEKGTVSYSVGGGIVADSDPELEFQETLAKGQGMRETIQHWSQEDEE